MARDDLKFKVLATDPLKGTITLRPTLGTILKMNAFAAGVVYVAVLITRHLCEDDIDRIRFPRTETPSE